MDEFVLIALLVGAFVFVIPLIAIFTAIGAKNAVKDLRAEIERLKIQSENTVTTIQGGVSVKPLKTPKIAAKENPQATKSKAASSLPEESATASEQSYIPPTPPQLSDETIKPAQSQAPPLHKGPSFMDRMAANFKANWIIWLAALSLAFGGLFIVQYGLERGFLGPVARVISALGFGAALLVVAEYLRRKPNMGMEGWFTVPVALATGGIASLFGGVVSAHTLYDLTSPLIGFASMVAVSFLAIGAGLIYGPVLAVIGILGAFVSPVIASTGEGHPIMYLYFLSVLVSALTVERMRRWIWLSSLAVGLTLLAGMALNDTLSGEVFLALYIAATILLATAIPAFGIKPTWGSHFMLDEKTLGNISAHYPTVLSVLTAAGGTAALCFAAQDNLILWQATLLTFMALIIWSVFWCNDAQNLDQLSPIFMAGLLVSASVLNPLNGYPTVENPARFFTFVGSISAIAAVAFMVASFWRTARSVRPVYWVACGAIAPVLTYFLTYAEWHQRAVVPDRTWIYIAVLLALFLASSAFMMLRSKIRHRRLASDLYFAGMLITASYAAYLVMISDYLAHTAAVLSLAALALVIRFKYRWTGYLIWAFVAAATSLVIIDLLPDYSLSQPVLLVIAVFGVAAGLLAVGYMMAQNANLPNRAILYETATLLTIALLICALIARYASGGRWEFGHMVLGLYATVWILLAGVQFRRMSITDNLNKIRKYLSYGYAILGLGALSIAIVMSPLLIGKLKGTFPLDTVMVAYALPTLALYGLYHYKLLPGFISQKIALGFTSLLSTFIFVQEVRRFWHGSIIHLDRGTEVGELYTYTVVMLTATVATVTLAITRKNPILRKAGLALAALTAAKVFLWDTAEMQGLARATVFIALGLTLAGVGWLLQITQSENN